MSGVPAVSFRRLREDDLLMLHEWLGKSHVAEWWGAPPSLAEVHQEFLPLTDDHNPVLGYVALMGGEMVARVPIGFIQSYVVMGSGDGWWPDEQDPGARGIDQFLADPFLLGMGLGSAMVRAFVEQLFADAAVTRVQTDPDPSNARAIRAYEKAGFRREREVDTPDGRALLMIRERPARPG